MGPKKETKKKGGKADGPITIDPIDFIREETDLAVLGGVSNLDTTLSGDIFNIEEIFPEWNDEEVWTDISDHLKSYQVNYPPSVIQSTEEKSIAQHLGLKGDLESEKKGKKPTKDFAFDDAAVAEDGSPVPRVYIGSDPTEGSTQFQSNELYTTFQKRWTLDQLHRKAISEIHVTDHHPTETSGHRPSISAGKDGNRPVSRDAKKHPPSRGAKKEGEDATIPTLSPEHIPPAFAEEPHGDEIDPFMCHVFRLIARFHPSLVDSGGNTPPFLWRAIYPQLPSGKPCYNKVGKYCVKVFVGGKWRKVTVTDIFPVDNGQIMLANSTNPYELWPSILSKAVYTVYSASGYHHTLADLSFHRNNASAVSSFLSFALHTLSGWLPSTPCSLKEIFHANSPRLQTIIDEISLGGAVIVQQSEIPSEEAIRMLPDEDNQNRQRTKKQLRDLLLRKKMEKENLIRDIHIREAIIEKISEALSRPFGEVYYLHAISSNEGNDRIIPVLGACHPDPSDPLSTMVLIKWVISAMVYSDAPGSEDVPGSTPVSYEWVLLRDLCTNYREVYLCGLDSRLRTPYCAEWSWHWGDIPDKVEDGKGKGKKEKEAKPKDKKGVDNSTPLGVPFRGQDRGIFPPVLLKIDPKALTENPDTSYFSLSVNIQSDLALLQGDHDRPAKSTFTVPDDAVLVLQEIRTDNEEPLVMKVQLAKEDLSYPTNRVTFNIPLQRFPRDPVLFWVRLFTKASIFMSFHSPAPIEIMEAKNIWQNTGGQVWELSGTTLPTYAKTEQLLFRIPIQFSPSQDGTSAPGDDSVLLFLHTSNRAVMDTLSLVVIDQTTGNSRVLPNINGNCFHLTPSDQITVIARCFHSSLNIPEFSWKASVLSRMALIPPDSKMNCLITTEKGSKQRYFGSYASNNALRIFRDVISVDTSDFPISLRLSFLPLINDSSENINLRDGSSKADVTEHLWFIARIYRKSDRKLLHEYSARSLLQIYLLERDNLTPEQDGNEAEVEKKGGGKAPKGGGDKKKKGEVDAVEFILDVLLDETKMTIPAEWRSRYPFKFRKYQTISELGDMDEKLNEGVDGQQPHCHIRDIQFHWQLDVLAGKILKMQHDTYDLERYAAMKNKWEDDAPGRRSRALAGRSYWTTRITAMTSNSSSIDDHLVDKLIPDLAEALEKEESLIGQKERQLKFLSSYQEDIQGNPGGLCSKGEGDYLSHEILEQEKLILQSEIEKWKENAQLNHENLMKYNQLYRQDTVNRMQIIHEQISGSYEEAIAAWAGRENYRSNIEKKNESLGYLLQRANEALIKAFPNENEDPKAKKKGKK